MHIYGPLIKNTHAGRSLIKYPRNRSLRTYSLFNLDFELIFSTNNICKDPSGDDFKKKKKNLQILKKFCPWEIIHVCRSLTFTGPWEYIQLRGSVYRSLRKYPPLRVFDKNILTLACPWQKYSCLQDLDINILFYRSIYRSLRKYPRL